MTIFSASLKSSSSWCSCEKLEWRIPMRDPSMEYVPTGKHTIHGSVMGLDTKFVPLNSRVKKRRKQINSGRRVQVGCVWGLWWEVMSPLSSSLTHQYDMTFLLRTTLKDDMVHDLSHFLGEYFLQVYWSGMKCQSSRWWFQVSNMFLNFHPWKTWRKFDPIWLAHLFSDGWFKQSLGERCDWLSHDGSMGRKVYLPTFIIKINQM